MTDFAAQFEKSGLGGWTLPMRRNAIERLAALGFPTSKDEDWKYTPVGPILEAEYQRPRALGPPNVPTEWLDAGETSPDVRLVFWNGEFIRGLSHLAVLPRGATVTPLTAALAAHRSLVEPHLGSLAKVDSGFIALNAALMDDGAFIHVGDGVILSERVQLIFIADPEHGPIAFHPRNLIVLGAGAEVSVIETHLGWNGEGPYLNNPVTEAVLGEGAKLNHFKEQLESPVGFHVGRLAAESAAGAQLASHTLAIGGRIAHSEVIARLAGPRSSCTLNGLYVGRGHQLLDTSTRIEHLSPGCRSRELYHGILDDQAKGIFTGRVLVTPQAQQTDAGQTNRNLLLSEDAEAKTRPHLQILADDVKCSHGATVGQLDDAGLFYLRSRGIPLETARSMLTWGFAAAVTSALPIPAWRKRAERRLTGWLVPVEAAR